MSDDLGDDDDEDEVLWSCGACALLVVDDLHCPMCGACCPWGCGMDHDEDDEDVTAFDRWDGYDPDDEFGGGAIP